MICIWRATGIVRCEMKESIELIRIELKKKGMLVKRNDFDFKTASGEKIRRTKDTSMYFAADRCADEVSWLLLLVYAVYFLLRAFLVRFVFVRCFLVCVVRACKLERFHTCLYNMLDCVLLCVFFDKKRHVLGRI